MQLACVGVYSCERISFVWLGFFLHQQRRLDPSQRGRSYTHTHIHTHKEKEKKKGMIVIQKMLSFLFTFFPVSSLSFRSSPLTRFLVARIAFSRPQISVLYRARAAKAGRQGKQQQQEYRKLETKDKGKSRVASSSCYCVSCKSDDFYKLHKRKEGFCV
jgi:hypothetical protein